MSEAIGDLIGVAGGLAQSALNNHYQQQLTEKDRRENYYYGELAANSADRRTRALYNDFYSPEALLKQYKEAGLSPSMMFGGTPGQGGMSGAQGSGASGIQTPYMPISILEGIQAANIAAQTAKTKEETKNIAQDTKLKEIETEWQDMGKQTYKTEYELITAPMYTENGEETSMYEIAEHSKDIEDFTKKIREAANKGGREDLKMYTGTEAGQKVIRSIYMSANVFDRDIDVLSSDKVSANFQSELLRAMKKEGFIEMNAKAAIGYLKANIQTAELTETQKEAWNNLIDRLGGKGSTTRDIVVVLGMILNNAMSNWHMPNVNFNNTTNNNNKTILKME